MTLDQVVPSLPLDTSVFQAPKSVGSSGSSLAFHRCSYVSSRAKLVQTKARSSRGIIVSSTQHKEPTPVSNYQVASFFVVGIGTTAGVSDRERCLVAVLISSIGFGVAVDPRLMGGLRSGLLALHPGLYLAQL